MRWLIGLCVLVAVGVAVGWTVSAPVPLPRAALAALPGHAGPGKMVFNAAGCASCHVATGDKRDGAPVLAGGQSFATKFGTFRAPNISPDPEHGIGGWSDAEIMNAVMRGVSPEGAHYYPSLPYTSYIKADPGQMADMVAYLRTLPASDTPSQPHDLSFPFTIRRSVGLWNQLFLRRDWVMADADADTPELLRGRDLVEALGHCAECHTPRNALGGLDTDAWLTGAANPSGKGRIPGIAPGQLNWSDADIAAYLTTGLTPDYDSAGGEMVAVIDKLSKLPDSDISAIVAYLRATPEAPQNATAE